MVARRIALGSVPLRRANTALPFRTNFRALGPVHLWHVALKSESAFTARVKAVDGGERACMDSVGPRGYR